MLDHAARLTERVPALRHLAALPVGTVALSLCLGGQAFAQTTATQSATDSVQPVATDSVTPASPSVPVTTGMPASTESIPAGTASIQASTESIQASPSVAVAPSKGWPAFQLPTSWPQSPIPVNVDVRFDGLGQGQLSFGGYQNVPVSAGGVSSTVPGIVNASPSVGAGGFGIGADAGWGLLGLGVRYQNYGIPATGNAALLTAVPPGATTTTFSNYGVFFPASYSELYGRLLGIKVGLRQESYADQSAYTDAIAALNLGFSLFDVVGANLNLGAGYALAKGGATGSQSAALAAAGGAHVPIDLDAHAFAHVGPARARLGWRFAGVADGDAGSIVSVFTNPAGLLASGGQPSALVQATRYGGYAGPYLGIELGF